MSNSFLLTNQEIYTKRQHERHFLINFGRTIINYTHWAARNSWSTLETACLITTVDQKNIKKQKEGGRSILECDKSR